MLTWEERWWAGEVRTPGRENRAKFEVEGYGMFEGFRKVLFGRS